MINFIVIERYGILLILNKVLSILLTNLFRNDLYQHIFTTSRTPIVSGYSTYLNILHFIVLLLINTDSSMEGIDNL